VNSNIQAKAARLLAAAFLTVSIFVGLPISASGLTSEFFSNDATALQVMSGSPYNMYDPAWLINISSQNRNIFAYKIFAGLFMLGYQTEMGYMYGLNDSQLRALYAFQANYGLPVSSLVTSACLQQMDLLLVQREQQLAPIANTFQLYDHMQPLNANDISKDTLATIYTLPISVLPPALQMSQYEQVQCIAGQCDGFVQDSGGNNLPGWPTPIDISSAYRFVGAYFDPRVYNSRLPSAAVHVDTVLHEYAHYLDNIFHWTKTPLQPHMGMIDTTGFYDILYDLTSGIYCYTPRSTNPKDWVTKYGFNPGYGGCTNGQKVVFEEWAEAFSMYVAAGRNFRAAAQQSSLIAQQYDWLKNNVFGGLEYDTNLPRDLESGCNDVHGESSAQPGYASCSDSYIWDYALPVLQYGLSINASGNGSGTISSPSGGIEFTYPTTMTENVAFNSGAVITLTATAGSGATVAWSGNCNITGGAPTVSTCSISGMDTAKIVTATFSMTPVNASCGPSNGQTLQAKPSTGLCSGGTPNAVSGIGPWSWACQGLYGGTSAACSADITAYTLTTGASGNGSGTIIASEDGISYTYPTTNGKSILLNSGMAVTLTATSDAGSSVVWSGDCSSSGGSSTVATCEITSMDGTKTIMATFSLVPVSGLCGSANDMPLTTAPTTNLCAVGTPTAVSGAGPWTWNCQGSNGGSNASCSANVQQWKVTPSAGNGGSINPFNYQMVNNGGTAQFAIIPDTGYHITLVSGCGGSLVSNTYTTGVITADCTVTTSFTRDTHTVTPSAAVNGSISPSTAQTVYYGSTASFTITPNSGYSATVGGTCGGSPASGTSQFTYATSGISGDCTVAVTFSLTPVNGQCGAANNGSFASQPTDNLCSQGTASAVGGSGPWTWTCQGVGDGSTANCSAGVSTYVLTVTKAGTGAGTVTVDTDSLNWNFNTGTANYAPDTSVNISACADPESSFAGWTGDCIGNGSPCSIVMSAVKSVTATFHLLSCDEKLVRIQGTSYYYQTIQDAYNLLNNGENAQIQALSFAENLVLQKDTDVQLEGGYDCNYSSNSGVTTINGSLTIQGGTVTIEELIIE
jgi:hypothetical protein